MTNTNGNLLQSNLDLSALSPNVQLFNQEVITPSKRAFVDKDEIIDLMGIALIARENLFLLGPPGTAKSALVRSLANRRDGRVFDYLLTNSSILNSLLMAWSKSGRP
jgi:MoxR-like ATPase